MAFTCFGIAFRLSNPQVSQKWKNVKIENIKNKRNFKKTQKMENEKNGKNEMEIETKYEK